nr:MULTISPECIES: gamma-glutamyltransferase family protein [Luteimonas]
MMRAASTTASALLLGLLLVVAPSCARETRPDIAPVPVAAVQATPPGNAVASAHALATEAGLQVMREGGNAFDAAVASRAGAAAQCRRRHRGAAGTGRSDRYRKSDGSFDRDRAENGPWSAGIPGLPAAFVHIAETYGALPLSKSLAPAIRIAEEGFPVYARFARGYQSRRAVMERYPGTRAVFLAGGRAPQEGDVFRQPDLARTLRLLAERGFDGFYGGETGAKLVAGAAYEVVEREPIRFRYHDWDVVTAPPPSSGGIAMAQMLQILEPYELPSLDAAARTHLVVESMRRAFRDRTFYLGDPDFVAVPQRILTSPDYAAGLRATIHPDRATPSDLLSGAQTPLEDDETTHFSIVDAAGNRAAVTQTVNLLFGSGLVAPGTGVLLNNEMDDFALQPGVPNAFGVMGFDANAPKPGKRPLSSMTPTFLVSDDRVAVLGTPGGSRIITMVLLGILGFDAGLDAQGVAALPRYHHQWMPDVVSAESDAFSADTAAALRAMGHTVDLPGDRAAGGRGSSHVWGNLQTIEWNRAAGTLTGGSDPRNPTGAAKVDLRTP